MLKFAEALLAPLRMRLHFQSNGAFLRSHSRKWAAKIGKNVAAKTIMATTLVTGR